MYYAVMRYLYIVLLVSIFFAYACDESSNSGSMNQPDPGDGQTNCFTPQEVFESDCRAEELTNMCTTYSCHFTIGNIVSDGSFPPCPADTNSCVFVDCTTLMCGNSTFFDISASENGLGYSFDSTDSIGQPIEVGVTCNAGGLFSFTCEDGGTIFN